MTKAFNQLKTIGFFLSVQIITINLSAQWSSNGNILSTNSNVGIGTTSPKASLSFQDVDLTSSPLGITWYNGGSPADATGYGIHRTAGTWVAPYYQQLRLGWLTGIVLDPGLSYGKSYVDIQGNGLRVSSGNVGLGTLSPEARLHVADGTYGEQIKLTRGTGGIRFLQDYNKDNLYLANNDASKYYMFWREDGNVGIGTVNPQEKLSVAGNILMTGAANYFKIHDRMILQTPATPGNQYTRSIVGQNIIWNEVTNKWSIPDQIYSDFSMMRFENGSTISFYNKDGVGMPEISNGELEAYRRLTITNTSIGMQANVNIVGNVGIGTESRSDYRFAVNGDAIFTKVKVKQYGSWPDYVFQPTYKLPNLSEVEAFIQQHKHLPDVPSAKEVAEKGLDVGENQAVLLKKIEELTLYIIEQQKEIEVLKEQVKLIQPKKEVEN